MRHIFKLRQVSRSSDILALAGKIKEDYPYCISMYNNLLMNGRGHNRCFQYHYYVPANYSESHIVIWVKMTKPRAMGIHCSRGETSLVTRILQSDDFLALMKVAPGILSHLPEYLTRPLSETLQERVQKTIQVFSSWTITYVSQQNYPLRCPAGFKVLRLNKTGIHHLLHMSQFNKDDSTDLVVKLTKSLPALGFYIDPSSQEESIINLQTLQFAESEEVPVSWSSMHHYGPFGMSGTLEAYRGRGLYRILNEMMGRMLMIDGYFPHAHVDPDNEVVLKVIDGSSGWNNTHCANWLIF